MATKISEVGYWSGLAAFASAVAVIIVSFSTHGCLYPELLKTHLTELKKAGPFDRTAIMEAEQKITELIKGAREQSAKAGEIEDAVYDLKAVNPNAKGEEDTRTQEELLDLIEAKSREIAEALSVLRKNKTLH